MNYQYSRLGLPLYRRALPNHSNNLPLCRDELGSFILVVLGLVMLEVEFESETSLEVVEVLCVTSMADAQSFSWDS